MAEKSSGIPDSQKHMGPRRPKSLESLDELIGKPMD